MSKRLSWSRLETRSPVARRRGGDRSPCRRPLLRARQDSQRLHGQERRLRAHVRAPRDVRARPRPALRVHAAALRLLPRARLLDLRARMVVGRLRADPGRDRYGVPRLRDRRTSAVAQRGRLRSGRLDAEPVPSLARRPPEPRDPRPAARGGARAVRARRGRSQVRAVVAGSGRVRGARDPRQRPALGAAALPRGVPARPNWLELGARRVARRGRGHGCAMGRAQPRRGRLLRARDRRARTVEGEQPADVRLVDAREVDRRRQGSTAPSLPEPGGGTRHLPARRWDVRHRRVRQRGVLPAQGLAVRARPPRREGEARRARRADGMGSTHDRVRHRLRPRRPADVGAAALHVAALRTGADRPLLCAASLRGARAAHPRVPDARRHGVRRRDALPHLDRLPARAPRRRRVRARPPPRVKVLHVHRIGGIGGSERHLLTLLPALAERGADVRFLGLDDPSRAPDPFYEALTVPYERLAAPRDVDPALALCVGRAVRSADLVHTHLVHADVYGALGARRLVSTKHNDDPFRAGAFRFVERALAHRASRVIAITHSLARFQVERVGLPAAKVEVIHYGLDDLPQAWGTNPPDPVPPDARVLLCICRLEPQKGVDVAIRALPEIPGAHLVVLGEGPQRPALEQLARESDVPVYLPGRVPDVAAWLRRASMLVHPVRWEGFGLALLEAMLAALPGVATRVSSVPEIVVDGETGLLVPAEDAAALAAAVSRVLHDPGELGAHGLRRARAEFSVARMADRTLDAYRRATST